MRGLPLWLSLFPAALAFSIAGCETSRTVRLAMVPAAGESRYVFEARGLEPGTLARHRDRWGEAFRVFVEPEGGPSKDGLPPIAGAWRVESDVLRFEPRFPLQPGLRYRARLDLGAGDAVGEGLTLEATFEVPARPLVPTAVVERVYPTAAVLPENQLKFYLHFSRPMRRGQAYDVIHLQDLTAGQEVEAPFLELGEELWDPTGTRFTLFFDPGRVKRGLHPREEVGAPLQAGRRYALVVDSSWLDAEGAPLRETFRKEFETRGPDYESPDPKTWKVTPPKAGTTEPLVLAFPEPLDHALLQRLFRVSGPQAAIVVGETTVGVEEREWRFQPNAAWKPGRHTILVDKVLEDMAGNSIGRPFEVDAARSVQSRIERVDATLSFEVASVGARGEESQDRPGGR